MNQEQIELAKKLISQSKILSSLEKAEWLQLLPEMNDKQILELTRILTVKIEAPVQLTQPAQTVQPTQPIPVPLPPQNLPKADLPLPRPQSSLPSRQQPLQPPLQQSVRPAPPPPPRLDQRSDQPPRIPDLPSRKETLPPPPRAAELKNKTLPTGIVAEFKPDFKTSDDFIKLTPGMLHGRDPHRTLQLILNSVTTFAKNRNGVAAIYSIERSPLYKAYVDYGVALLNKSSVQRELNQEEFEAFADFKKELDNLVI